MGRLEAHPTINILILWGGHPACPSQQGYLIYSSPINRVFGNNHQELTSEAEPSTPDVLRFAVPGDWVCNYNRKQNALSHP
jgi:hypothetical protein